MLGQRLDLGGSKDMGCWLWERVVVQPSTGQHLACGTPRWCSRPKRGFLPALEGANMVMVVKSRVHMALHIPTPPPFAGIALVDQCALPVKTKSLYVLYILKLPEG